MRTRWLSVLDRQERKVKKNRVRFPGEPRENSGGPNFFSCCDDDRPSASHGDAQARTRPCRGYLARSCPLLVLFFLRAVDEDDENEKRALFLGCDGSQARSPRRSALFIAAPGLEEARESAKCCACSASPSPFANMTIVLFGDLCSCFVLSLVSPGSRGRCLAVRKSEGAVPRSRRSYV